MPKVTQSDKTEIVGGFELKLPDIFDIKPMHEIDLPGGRKILVYDHQQYPDHNDRVSRIQGDPVPEKVSGWKLIVVNKKGNELRPTNNGYESKYVVTTTSPLAAMRWIKSMVLEFSKTKKTSTFESDPDADE